MTFSSASFTFLFFLQTFLFLFYIASSHNQIQVAQCYFDEDDSGCQTQLAQFFHSQTQSPLPLQAQVSITIKTDIMWRGINSWLFHLSDYTSLKQYCIAGTPPSQIFKKGSTFALNIFCSTLPRELKAQDLILFSIFWQRQDHAYFDQDFLLFRIFYHNQNQQTFTESSRLQLQQPLQKDLSEPVHCQYFTDSQYWSLNITQCLNIKPFPVEVTINGIMRKDSYWKGYQNVEFYLADYSEINDYCIVETPAPQILKQGQNFTLYLRCQTLPRPLYRYDQIMILIFWYDSQQIYKGMEYIFVPIPGYTGIQKMKNTERIKIKSQIYKNKEAKQSIWMVRKKYISQVFTEQENNDSKQNMLKNHDYTELNNSQTITYIQ